MQSLYLDTIQKMNIKNGFILENPSKILKKLL